MSTSDLTKNTLIALGSGCIFSLGFEPFGIWPLTILSITGLFYVVTLAKNNRETFQFAIAYGVGKFGVGVSWIYVSIHEFGQAPVALAATLVAVFVLGLSLLIWLVTYSGRKQFAMFAIEESTSGASIKCLFFTVSWLAYEYVIEFLFTGFPWLLSGYVLLDTPFNGLAPILGVHGLSLVVVIVATTLRYSTRYPKVLWQLLVLVPAWGFHGVLWTEKSEGYSVALVQANVPLIEKWNPANFNSLLNESMKLSRSAGEKDLVLWSEGALPATIDQIESAISTYLDNPEAVPLILGAMDVEENRAKAIDEEKFYNALGLFKPEEVSTYRKRKLVPFGEYVPLEDLLRGTIGFFDLPMSSFSSGEYSAATFTIDELRIAPFICYEIIYSVFVSKSLLRANASLLVVASEDSWFGKSIGPHQHLQIARMRALETGKYVLRATNSGVTAVIGPDGSVVSDLPQFEAGVLEENIFSMDGFTPYTKSAFGVKFGMVFLLMVVAWIAESLNRKIGDRRKR